MKLTYKTGRCEIELSNGEIVAVDIPTQTMHKWLKDNYQKLGFKGYFFPN